MVGGYIRMPRPQLHNSHRGSLSVRAQPQKLFYYGNYQKRYERRGMQSIRCATIWESSQQQQSNVSEPVHGRYNQHRQPVYTTAVASSQPQTDSQEEVQYVYEQPRSLQFGENYKFLQNKEMINTVKVAGLGFLGVTFVIALIRYAINYNSLRAKKMRQTNRNKYLVLELSKYLPADRQSLTWWKLFTIKFNTGFNAVEIYRKFLWYLLRERKFDQTAIDDLQYLAMSLRLKPSQVASAIKERADRIFKQYGTLMLDTSGMTAEGVERKAAGRALFSKLLYLTECEQLMDAEAAKEVDLRNIFGATEDDLSELRIVSLYDVDLDKMDAMISEGDALKEDY